MELPGGCSGRRRGRSLVSRWIRRYRRGKSLGKRLLTDTYNRRGWGARIVWLNQMQKELLNNRDTQQEETLQSAGKIEVIDIRDRSSESEVESTLKSETKNAQEFTQNKDDLFKYYKKSNMKLFWIAVSIAIAAFLIVLALNQLNLYKLPF